MKKVVLGLILGMLSFFQVSASHFAGGDCYYDYVGSTLGDNTRARFAVHYIFYRDINGAAFIATSITTGMYDASATSVSGVLEVLRTVQQYSRQTLNQYSPGCYYKSPIGYERVEFIDTVDLLKTNGYYFSTSNFARNGGQIQNISQFGPFSIVLSTYIPPAHSFLNSSPRFRAIPVPYNCVGKKYVFNHDGFDPDGDSLVFNIVWPYGQGGTYRNNGNVGEGGIPDFNVTTLPVAQRVNFPTRPMLPGNNTGVSGYYTPVNYQGAYSFPSNQVPAISPDTLKMASNTGEISFTPINQGGFVVAVECSEYRVDRINNTVTYLGSTRRDLQFYFDANCSQNNSPQIFYGTDSFTMQVGDTLNFNAVGIDFDPTNDTVVMGISGDIIGTGVGMASVAITPGRSQAIMNVRWIPSCANARTAPYFLIISAKDSLCAITQKTVYIKVLPKDIVRPVQNLTISRVLNGFELNWVNSPAKDFKMYRIFRSIDQNPFVEIDSIVQGSPNYYYDLKFPTIFDSVRYFLVGENTCNELGANSETIKYLNQFPTPFLPDTIKECGPIALIDAGNPGSNFLWNTGDTTQKITASQSGWYKVVISSSTASLTDSVYVDLLSVDLGNDTSICAGQSFSLEAKIGNNSTSTTLSNGLVGFWPFNGNANDESGHGFHATVYGPTLATDRFGINNRAYQFSNGIDFIETDSNFSPIYGYHSRTVSFWMKSSGNLTGRQSSVVWGTQVGCNGKFNVNTTASSVSLITGCGIVDQATSLWNNQWHLVTCVYDSTISATPNDVKFFIDGKQINGYRQGSNLTSLLYTQVGKLIFGKDGTNDFFNGILDEVQIWNRPLSASEVLDLFNNTKPYTYLWSTGDTTSTINVTPTQTTTYYCTISNGITTCTDSIVVTVNGTASANLFADTTSGCGNVTLSAGNNAGNVLWNTGATTSSIQVTQSGTYSVSIQAGGCTLTDTTFVDLLSVDLGNDTSICAGQTYLINPFVQGNPNLKNGLIAAYSFDGNAYDFSGNGNHGKPQGVTSTTDRFGNPNGAYFFRGYGNNDHVFVPNHPSMHIDSVYTMSLWYQEIPGNAMNGVGAYSPTNGTAALFAKEGDGIGTPPGFFADLNYNANGGYSLNYLQVDGCCGVRSKFQTQFSHPMQVDSTWKHLVIVNTKDYAETYINGVKVKFASMPSTFLAANRNNLYFGTYGYGKQSPFWYPFYGSMDEVFMYNRALDSNEIQSLYHLQNSQNAFSYAWSTGATTPYIGVAPSQTTTYYCTISNGLSTCTDSMTIVVKPNPPVVALPDTLFQCGNPARLDAGNPGATYLWSNKATTQSILPVNGGWYSVVVNQNGCTAIDSSYVDLLTIDLGRDTGICIGSSITLSVQGQNLGNTTPDSIFVPTDASWKVSILNPEGWEYVGFNDTNSFWPSAKIQGTSTISGAQPIWHPDSVGVYDVYFRKVFEVNGQPNPDFQLEISAENEYYAFVNGRFVGYGNSNMGGTQTYPIAQNLVQGYNSVAIFASNWGASTAQLEALITGTTDKKAYLWTTGDTTSSITVTPTQTTTYYCTVTNGYTFCTDSIVVRVGTPQTTSLQASTCSNQPYSFGGRLLSQPGVYVDSLRTSLGCDSVVTLTLNVKTTSIDSILVKICGNSGYLFGGVVRNQPGIYRETFTNSVGCDSLVVLTLNIAAPDTQRISASICSGTTYSFNGQNLTQSGIYSVSLVNAKGCDSLVILTLNVNSVLNQQISAAICSGNTYLFGNRTLTTPGIYVDSLRSNSGCDSIVTLNLQVNTPAPLFISASGSTTICNGTTVQLQGPSGYLQYVWSNGANSSSISTGNAGIYSLVATDSNGCQTSSNAISVVVQNGIPVTPTTITGDVNPCVVLGTSNVLNYSVPANSNVSSYLWSFSPGITPVGRLDSNVIGVTYSSSFTTGQISVVAVNSCGTSSSRSISLKTLPISTSPTFSQFVTAICAIKGTSNAATYTVQPIPGCVGYQWTVPANASIVSGQGTNSIQVTFGGAFSSGTISVFGLSPCGNSPTTNLTVALITRPIVYGPNSLCPGDVGTFSTQLIPGVSRYRFNLPAGLALVSQNVNTAQIRNTGAFVSGTLSVSAYLGTCGWSYPGNFSLNTSGCRVNQTGISFNVYPNPSFGEFYLQMGLPVNRVQISIFSVDGKLVKREVFEGIESQYLKYSDVSEGLYHMEIVATDHENVVHRHMEKLVIKR